MFSRINWFDAMLHEDNFFVYTMLEVKLFVKND